MEKERVSWVQSGSSFKKVEGNISNVPTPPVGIYNVVLDPMSGWSLEYVDDSFKFNFKIYDLETDFIDHVLKTYNGITGSMGILLNGIKGTGKTVTAKVLANMLKLPVIVTKNFGEYNGDFIKYLSSFNFDCVLFFDEFEKTWASTDCNILQIMDGVYTAEHRRVFLLTTNVTDINDNLISRPSRIRYLKEFGNISKEVVIEYLNDTLNDKSVMESVIDFVDTLQISTIDILKSIVEDINIHGMESFMEHKEIFNVKTSSYYYSVKSVSFRNLDQIKEEAYTTDKFLSDIKLLESLKEPRRWEFDSDDEFEMAMKEYYKQKPRRCPDEKYVSTIKSVKNFKVGDIFGQYDGEHVVQMDLDRKVIITQDEDDYMMYFYCIKDINAKPSLYSSPSTAYGVYGYNL